MQICEYFFENACYSVTKYYLCKQNNKRSLLGRKQQSQVARSFPNRYLFSYTEKVTSLFSISCILDIILQCKTNGIANREHWNRKITLTFPILLFCLVKILSVKNMVISLQIQEGI